MSRFLGKVTEKILKKRQACDKIANLKVSQAVELGNYLEEKYGIKAAAGAVMAAAPAGGGAAPAEAAAVQTEFAVILEEFPSRKELLKIARRMHSILCEPFSLHGSDIIPGASIGIVSTITEYSATENVLRDADIAMYRAKQRGKGLVLFDKRMHQEVIESVNLEAELREVLATDTRTAASAAVAIRTRVNRTDIVFSFAVTSCCFR